jgi:hypothetical protein
MKVKFENREEVIECLVNEWGYRTSQFYNNEKNKQVEKIWTLNRCARHLSDLRNNYYRDEYGGVTRKVGH